MEQLAARWAHNPKVTSSSLVPATRSLSTQGVCDTMKENPPIKRNNLKWIAQQFVKY